MRESMWGVFVLVVGVVLILLIYLFQGITNTDEHNYYLLKENDEITLPGMGVFFEILWQNTDESGKDFILNILKNSL